MRKIDILSIFIFILLISMFVGIVLRFLSFNIQYMMMGTVIFFGSAIILIIIKAVLFREESKEG